jgi:enolase
MPQVQGAAARAILDSRAAWTLEVTVTLATGHSARASVPHGKSTGSHEVPEKDPFEAVRTVRELLAPALRGVHLSDVSDIDTLLSEIDGTGSFQEIGGNTALAFSVATARAASNEAGIPLYAYFQHVFATEPRSFSPICYMNMINGGAHAGTELPIQEYLVGIHGSTIMRAVQTGARFYNALGEYLREYGNAGDSNVGDEGGFAPALSDSFAPLDIYARIAQSLQLDGSLTYGIDAAANDAAESASALQERYMQMVDRYNLTYIEDPFHEEAFDEWSSFRQAVSGQAYVVGDDLTTTNPERLRHARASGAADGIIIKPNQIGTLSTAIAVAKQARQFNWHVVVSHRSGDTCDDWIADVAAAVGADGVKFGAPARGERTSKYNRLLAIENLSQ